MLGTADDSRPLTSLADLLQQQAGRFPERVAFLFEDDAGKRESWTYAQLESRVRSLGAWIARQVQVGDRVLLVYPPGLEFIASFLGCVYAGALPVPATYPKPRRPSPRLESIARDCEPSLVLTHSSALGSLCLDQQAAAISTLTWEATDSIPSETRSDFVPVACERDDLAFLQYTSGSTSDPRGVMVSHGNLLHNLSAIATAFGISDEVHHRGVFWLPAYHDMGLIGAILTPLYVGGTSTLIAPNTFLRRPLRWLELMSEMKATISGAPNFGYELAARKRTSHQPLALDLSAWQLAFCGAEPIHPESLDVFAEAFAAAGFRRNTYFPCYGLAEATLLVTGGKRETGPQILHVDRSQMRNNRVVCRAHSDVHTQTLVGCGTVCPGMEFQIFDNATGNFCQDDQVGEIWVRGPSVASGYWNQPATNDEVFRARLPGSGSDKSLATNYLRTGDLGFRHDGELFVTGRLKDVIIVRGRNHYPQDLERTAQQSHEAVDGGAAFAVEVGGREEVVLVHQWRREYREADHEQMMHAIRTAVVDEHEIDPHSIVLIRPASLPVTSSGKVQRQRCRELFLAGDLPVTAQWINNMVGGGIDDELGLESTDISPEFLPHMAEFGPAELQELMQVWLIAWLTQRASLPAGSLRPDTQFAELGIDSMSAVEISQQLDEVLGLQSPPMVIWSCPTPKELAAYLTEELRSSSAK